MYGTKSCKNGITTVNLFGRFEFASHRAFRSIINETSDGLGTEFILDLSGVRYMDSAALGMLLILRERAEKVGKTWKLVGATGRVAQTLAVANFNKLFEIEN